MCRAPEVRALGGEWLAAAGAGEVGVHDLLLQNHTPLDPVGSAALHSPASLPVDNLSLGIVQYRRYTVQWFYSVIAPDADGSTGLMAPYRHTGGAVGD